MGYDTQLYSWTFFPELLPTLATKEQQAALETAVCASNCGRFQEASAIFDSQLPPSHDSLLLTLERSDMLTLQGIELQRVTLLSARLRLIGNQETTQGEKLLLELLLADAEYWAFGTLRKAVGKALEAKEALASRSMENLSNVEVSDSKPLVLHLLIPARSV